MFQTPFQDSFTYPGKSAMSSILPPVKKSSKKDPTTTGGGFPPDLWWVSFMENGRSLSGKIRRFFPHGIINQTRTGQNYTFLLYKSEKTTTRPKSDGRSFDQLSCMFSLSSIYYDTGDSGCRSNQKNQPQNQVVRIPGFRSSTRCFC